MSNDILKYNSNLPAGWGEIATPDGLVYYFEHATKKTQWYHPITRKWKRVVADLPPGWERIEGEDGDIEYCNKLRKVSCNFDPRLAIILEEKESADDIKNDSAVVTYNHNTSKENSLAAGIYTGSSADTYLSDFQNQMIRCLAMYAGSLDQGNILPVPHPFHFQSVNSGSSKTENSIDPQRINPKSPLSKAKTRSSWDSKEGSRSIPDEYHKGSLGNEQFLSDKTSSNRQYDTDMRQRSPDIWRQRFGPEVGSGASLPEKFHRDKSPYNRGDSGYKREQNRPNEFPADNFPNRRQSEFPSETRRSSHDRFSRDFLPNDRLDRKCYRGNRRISPDRSRSPVEMRARGFDPGMGQRFPDNYQRDYSPNDDYSSVDRRYRKFDQGSRLNSSDGFYSDFPPSDPEYRQISSDKYTRDQSPPYWLDRRLNPESGNYPERLPRNPPKSRFEPEMLDHRERDPERCSRGRSPVGQRGTRFDPGIEQNPPNRFTSNQSPPIRRDSRFGQETPDRYRDTYPDERDPRYNLGSGRITPEQRRHSRFGPLTQAGREYTSDKFSPGISYERGSFRNHGDQSHYSKREPRFRPETRQFSPDNFSRSRSPHLTRKTRFDSDQVCGLYQEPGQFHVEQTRFPSNVGRFSPERSQRNQISADRDFHKGRAHQVKTVKYSSTNPIDRFEEMDLAKPGPSTYKNQTEESMRPEHYESGRSDEEIDFENYDFDSGSDGEYLNKYCTGGDVKFGNNQENSKGNKEKSETSSKGPPGKDKIIDRQLKLCISPMNYPKSSLTKDEAERLMLMISDKIDQIDSKDNVHPRFHCCYYKIGGLAITCFDEHSQEWLKNVLNEINKKNLFNFKLKVSKGTLFKNTSAAIAIYLRNAKNYPHKKVMSELQDENPRVDMTHWTISTWRIIDNGVLFCFLIMRKNVKKLPKVIYFQKSPAKINMLHSKDAPSKAKHKLLKKMADQIHKELNDKSIQKMYIV